MSCCILDNEADGFEVTIGWEPSTASFCAHVSERGTTEKPLLSFGPDDRHLEPDTLIAAIRPYACAFDEALLTENLRFDQHTDSERSYGPLPFVTLPQDQQTIAKIYRLFEELDNYPAQVQDNAEDAAWARIVAECGVAEAQEEIAYQYYSGKRGAPQNHEEAFKWYRRAAEQGYARAQTSLGCMYGMGEGGVAPDTGYAIYWLKLAAEQQDPKAEKYLADLDTGATAIQHLLANPDLEPATDSESARPGKVTPNRSDNARPLDDGIKHVLIGAVIIGMVALLLLAV